jgi:hypothetical protein
MKIVFSLLSFSLLMFTLGMARTHQHASESCGFTVQGEPAQPTVQGPDDIAPLVYFVEQPDSPIEVVSVDLTGMWLSVANEQYSGGTVPPTKFATAATDLSKPLMWNSRLAAEGDSGLHRLRWHLAKLPNSRLAEVADMEEYLGIT